jgi:excinuclease ABC subunit A
MMQYMSATLCPRCKGRRLRPESLAVTIPIAGQDRSIADFTELSLERALEGARAMNFVGRDRIVADRLQREIVERLEFLNAVGLGYLSLNRSAATLSGGEGQRIRLATQIGSRLRGVLYVLDEPSIGLHQRDNQRLLDTLANLRDLGNTVIVVEHDEDAIRQADHVVDLGPGAGVHGGAVVAQGTAAEVAAHPDSITGQYLSGRRRIEIPPLRRSPDPKRMLRLVGASANNLKNVTAEFPLGLMTCITGVSGSGKSTLINDTLFRAVATQLNHAAAGSAHFERLEGLEHIDRVIEIDQSPIGRTPRSNPATYTGLFAPIREIFASVPESRARGYEAGRFSFNVKGGRCEACQGDGVIKVEMHFLADVYVPCDVCRGKRYNRETLEIRFKGKNIQEVLDMTVEDALPFFSAVPTVQPKLQTLMDVGLSYVRLGQSATTLSGGEAQRVKLSKELSKRATGRTLYILDEPTTGLHFADIAQLLAVLHRLRDEGNTIIVIEHNLDVIKTADWVVDLGPEGGDGGGKIIAVGTPEQIAANKASYTGHYLKTTLGEQRTQPARRKRA